MIPSSAKDPRGSVTKQLRDLGCLSQLSVYTRWIQSRSERGIHETGHASWLWVYDAATFWHC